MDNAPVLIESYVHPSSLHRAPVGTLWKVLGDHQLLEIFYIQISHDEEKPLWYTIPMIIDKILSPYSDMFVQECIALALDDKRSLAHLGHLISQKIR